MTAECSVWQVVIANETKLNLSAKVAIALTSASIRLKKHPPPLNKIKLKWLLVKADKFWY